MDDESDWLDARGGDAWLRTHVVPFYRTWMGLAAAGEKARGQIGELRARAHELGADEIASMLGMQWRVQVVGAWFAIARIDAGLSDAVHGAFDRCSGNLTAPALTVAALTYSDQRTSSVLRTYRDRASARQWGGEDFIDAALRRLESEHAPEHPSATDNRLSELRSVRDRLQSRP